MVTRMTKIEWILSNIALVVVLLNDIWLNLIPSYFSINDFLNSGSINSYPWSYIIYVDQWYFISHIVSTNLTMVIVYLSTYVLLCLKLPCNRIGNCNRIYDELFILSFPGYFVGTFYRYKISSCGISSYNLYVNLLYVT